MTDHTRFGTRMTMAIAMIALVAGACSSGTTPSASTGGAASAPAASVPAASQPAGSEAASGAAGGGDLTGQTVSVIGTWGGDEEAAFKEMVAPWEAQTGAKVELHRHPRPQHGPHDRRRVGRPARPRRPAGTRPDGPVGRQPHRPRAPSSTCATYESETAPALVELGKVNGKTVGVFIKTAVKGLIWFDPKVIDFGADPAGDLGRPPGRPSPPTRARPSRPGAWASSRGAASGWPATDWIEDLVLRQAGPDVYNSWWQGKTKWTDPAIKTAFQTYRRRRARARSAAATPSITTNFEEAGDPLFATPPGCLFLHQASFITGLGDFKTKAAGTDYNFFPFPDINPQFTGAIEGAGDLFGMFHDTPAAKSLMAYLVTAPAQDIWVKHGGALSANKNATTYPDDISKRSAALLQNAKIFAFDASDLMPTR